MTNPEKNPKYPELLSGMAEHLKNVLASHGIDPEIAADAALEAAEFLRHQWGGQNVYLPKGMMFELSERDLKIWDKWNGRNALELCREYDISKQRLYQIIAAVREREVAKRQMPLIK